MPLLAVGLVLASCALHAFWNLLLKQARDKQAFTALFLLAVPVLYLPLLLACARHSRISGAGWACIGVTGLAYAAYFIGLAEAYRDGDLSVAYPLARSLGPVLTFAGAILVLGERPTGMGAAGVALVLAGALALQRQARPGAYEPVRVRRPSRTIGAVLLVALMYGIYSLVDKTAVGRLGVNPIVYLWCSYTLAALLVAGWLSGRRGALALGAEWRASGRVALAVGALNPFAYLLVLYAMALPGTPVSYIVPLRTGSVLLGVLLGVGVLKEGRLAAKLALAAVMALRISLIAIKG